MRDEGGGEYRIGQGVPELEAPATTPELARKRIAEALQNRLELKAVDAAARALDRGEDAARAGGWPRLEGVADGTYANPNPRYFPPQEQWKATWSAGVQATFQLDAPFLSDARADEIAAQRESTRGRRTGLVGAIANEVVTAQADVMKARAALVAGETSVRASQESYRVTTDRFQVGRATPTDLIDVESELLAAKLTVVNARIDLVIAALQLDHALGR
jgi:outer membrane protein TolC